VLKGLLRQFLLYLRINHPLETSEQSLRKFPRILDIFTGVHRGLLQLGGLCRKYDDPVEI
jgi:hypothetical protein